jgi:hypothetical protein
MKPKNKMLVLIFSLMAPYMGFVIYRVFTHPQHPLPGWFLYVGPCYFIGSIILATVLRKRIIGRPVPLPAQEQKAQRISAAHAARRMGYVWLIGPVLYLYEWRTITRATLAYSVYAFMGGIPKLVFFPCGKKHRPESASKFCLSYPQLDRAEAT